MIAMSLAEAATALGVPAPAVTVPFEGCSTDSRQIEPGQLFVALEGPNFDGHCFVEKAASRGAAAVLISKPVDTALPTLEVAHTVRALGELAGNWRSRFDAPVIGITGSNGKTTVKEMLASILARRGAVLATRGNLNNEIGVPITLFGFDAAHRAAVIEMGANGPGEIARLAAIARPTTGLITLCAPAHLSGFGSIDSVAEEKGRIYAGLGEQGIAVLNVDDTYARRWRELIGTRRTISFGLDKTADVSATWQGTTRSSDMELDVLGDRAALRLPVPGRHNVINALAAAAAAAANEVPLDAIVDGLSCFSAAPGRLQLKAAVAGGWVLDDTYNSNPSSLHAALQVLREHAGVRWVVLGDMAELGEEAEAIHAEAGRAAKEAKVEQLWAVGPLSQAAVDAFGAGGRHFSDKASLVASLAPACGEGMTVLVKGSRSARMEHVVQALCESSNLERSCC